jgi:prepilin-type N-terminal cleavage/methylation domain-containing protein/prepilin-type processing-associated H-X9-DG protein
MIGVDYIWTWTRGRSGRGAGFTLVELLVVSAMLGLLAALLFPTFVRAKGAAKAVQCANNQRQLTTIWTMYTGDNSDGLASNGRVDPPDPGHKLWVQGAFFHVLADTNSTLLLDPSYALFGSYLQTRQTYSDPTYPDDVVIENVAYPKVRSYALNAYLGWSGQWDYRMTPGFKVFLKQSELVTPGPAQTFTFQDANPKSICWPYFGIDMGYDEFFNWPNSDHDRGGVLAYADGHVQRHRWKDARTIQAYSPDYHVHQDASPGNVDLVWLREHTTTVP